MTLSRYLFLSVLAFIFLVTPVFPVHAQVFPGDVEAPGLVPCGDPGDSRYAEYADQCQLCHLENLSRDLLRLAIYVAVFLATLAIAFAGFKMITAQGDSGALTAAKDILIKAILGLVFVLAAWLIVDTLMKFFYSGGARWNDFGACVPQPAPKAPPKEADVTVVPVVPNDCTIDEMGGVTCPTPAGGTLSDRDARNSLRSGPRTITVAPGVNLEGVNTALINTFKDVNTATGYNFTLTAAKNGTHQNGCHIAGECLDIVCTSCGTNASKLQEVIKATQAKGYCAVYEPKGGTKCPVGVKPCLENPKSTGDHYSFYMRSSQSPSCKL